RRIGDRGDRDRERRRLRRGRAAVDRRRGDAEREVGVAVGGRRDGEAGQLRRRQAPYAAALVGSGGQRRARRHVGDGDRQGLGRIGERRTDRQRDRAILVAGRVGDRQRRHVGDPVDRDRQQGRAGP